MPPRDPEFDGNRAAPGPGPPADAIAYCQRLIANPFLAIAILSATLALAVHLSRPASVGHGLLLPGLFAGLTGSYFALQYHCLDCGATGMVHRWQRHACPKVRERWDRGFDFWSRLRPTLRTQVALWYIVLIGAGVALAVLSL